MKYYADKQRHLVCIPYSKENLHRMAKKLRIKKCWFHKTHYDMPKGMHKIWDQIESMNVKNNITRVTPRAIVHIIKHGNLPGSMGGFSLKYDTR